MGSVSGDLSRRLWEDHAEWWIDGFTDGADPEYEDQIIPLVVQELAGVETVLDVGTGDGQIARALSATGCEVTGVDPTSAQISVAVERGGGPRYVQAGACRLPFDDESFDAALACLVFEHIDDVDGAISEVARVLRPGGSFNFLLNHPLLQTPDSGWIDDHMVEPPEQYWRIGNYLDETETIEQVESGVHIRFCIGRCRAISMLSPTTVYCSSAWTNRPLLSVFLLRLLNISKQHRYHGCCIFDFEK